MRRMLSLFIALVYSLSAFADGDPNGTFEFDSGTKWGTGQNMATICPTPKEDAAAAQANQDYLANLDSEIRSLESQILALRGQQNAIQLDIGDAKTRMNFVLKFDAIAAIDEHFTHQRDMSDYKKICPLSVSMIPGKLGGRFPAADLTPPGEMAEVEEEEETLPGAVADTNPGGYDIPEGFCQAGVNHWKDLGLDNGKVRPEICQYGGIRGVYVAESNPTESNIRLCKENLTKFYDLKVRQGRLSRDISALESQLNGRIAARNTDAKLIAEGRFDINAKNHIKTTSDQANLGQQLLTTGVVLVAALMQAGQNGDDEEEDEEFDEPPRPPRRGPGDPLPAVLPPVYSPYPGASDVGSFDGDGMTGEPLPTRYRANVDGYYSGPDVKEYGSVEGASGQGGFSCNDVNQKNGATDMSAAMLKMFAGMIGNMMNGGGSGKGKGKGKRGRGRGPRGQQGPVLGGPPVLAPRGPNGQLRPVYNPHMTDHYGSLLQLEADLGLIQGGGLKMPNLGSPGPSTGSGSIPAVLPPVDL